MEQKIDMLESERTIIEMGWKLEIVVFIWPKNLFIWVIMVFVSYLSFFFIRRSYAEWYWLKSLKHTEVLEFV